MGTTALINLGKKWDCLQDVEQYDGSLDRIINEKSLQSSEIEVLSKQLFKDNEQKKVQQFSIKESDKRETKDSYFNKYFVAADQQNQFNYRQKGINKKRKKKINYDDTVQTNIT